MIGMDPHPTRISLIQAAMQQFGRGGFEAASTRAIAAQAGTNISSIAYHFGGKDGLRIACADAVAERIAQVARPLPGLQDRPDPRHARLVLRRLVRRIVTFMIVSPGASDAVAFVLRELAQPDSPVLDRLYTTLVEPRHRALCALWSAATGEPAESEDVKLAVFSLVGQAVYFRVAAPIVRRRMGWRHYARAEARAITRRMLTNLDRMIGGGDG
ncbi:CerR family C-terminal domain-containing protein [Paracoccus denitrificans]|uniref:CerR family C-terminal domain-containing protein n=2 Tax=Paracoccus denitrificans TaxID=266 RepID=UPI000CEC0DC9|nr:CerR family C-terminal domain-containing protein [Paracoccus denitrificans]